MPPAHRDNVDVELRRVRNRELELKRITGEISCAECRRLKLKCDKKVPCSSCIRRGCKQICPTGTSTGSTGRQIAINSAPLPVSGNNDMSRKLTAMSERIRALEDALEIQSGESSHPLLAPEFLAIKQGIDVVNRRSHDNDDAEDGLAGAFGTLSVSEGKTMRFLGATAADSVLLMEVFDGDEEQSIGPETLSRELMQASTMWPFVPAYLSKKEHIMQLVSHLPPYERVTSLLEAYFSNLAWFIAPVDRSQINEEILPVFYPQRRAVSPALVDAENLHELALLFSVFACGSVADLTLTAINHEGEMFNKLTRAALGLRSFLDYGSLAASQTLFLLGAYEIYSARRTSSESSWKCMSMGLTIASSVGLHRDPSRWKLDSKMVDWRRRTFWEMNSSDKWKCLGSGRPPVFPPYTIDCELPLDRGATVEEDGVVVESVWQWRYRFTRDVLPFLLEKLCAARPPKYSDIMEMDKIVRNFELHPFVNARPKASAYVFNTDGDYRSLHPYITLWWKEMALLYVHRNCFARALLEYPNDPIRSPFGPSFLATYRSSVTLLALLEGSSKRMAPILQRLWALWAISLSCAVVVGTVACRVSTVQFAPSALKELHKAIEVFEAGIGHPVARQGLKLLHRIREKALAAHDSQRPASTEVNTKVRGGVDALVASRTPRAEELLDDAEELDILRGTTRFIEQRNYQRFNLPGRAIEQHTRPYPDYTNAGATSSASRIISTSPDVGFSSTPGSMSPRESLSTPGSSSRANVFYDMVRNHGADPFAPSPLVQTTSGSASKTGDTAMPREPCELGVHQYDDYLPPFVESGGQQSCHTTAGPCAVAKNLGEAGPDTVEAHNRPTGSDQTQTAQAHQPESAAPLPGTTQHSFGLPNLADESPDLVDTNMSLSTNPFTELDPQIFMSFDPIADPAGATSEFFSGPVPDPQTMAELNALYQKESGNNVEAWHSFMKQFELANPANFSTGYEAWEEMVFS